MKFFTLLILALSFLSFSTSELQDDERIKWKDGQHLSWDDFKGQPLLKGNYVANTNSGISFAFSYKELNGKRDYTYTVDSYFYPNESWFVEGAVNDHILKHEQTHFDITELFARKLKKKLQALDPQDKNFRKNVERVYKTNETERVNYQTEFDWETNHSIIIEEEEKWEEKVAKELALFAPYKS